MTSADNGYFSSLPAPVIQYSHHHCSHVCGATRPWPGLQPQSCHFRFNLRKTEIDWEVFMQIRTSLRNYLATGLMDMLFLEMNLTFCFSCQRGSVWSFWPMDDRGRLMYFVLGSEPGSCPVGGHPSRNNGGHFWLGGHGKASYPCIPHPLFQPTRDQKY